MSFHHCTPTYTIATSTLLCVEKTWLQKKEICICDNFVIFCNLVIMTGVLDEHVEINADEKDEPFEDWARIF